MVIDNIFFHLDTAARSFTVTKEFVLLFIVIFIAASIIKAFIGAINLSKDMVSSCLNGGTMNDAIKKENDRYKKLKEEKRNRWKLKKD